MDQLVEKKAKRSFFRCLIPGSAAALSLLLSACASSSGAAAASPGSAIQDTAAASDQSAAASSADPGEEDSKKIIMQRMDEFCHHLDVNEIKYIRNQAENLVRVYYSVDEPLKNIVVMYRFLPDGFFSSATILQKADDISAKYAVMEFVTRINFLLLNGGFEMDMSDGQIFYKVYTIYEGMGPLSDQLMDRVRHIPIAMFQRYADSLIPLIEGKSDVRIEMEKIKRKRMLRGKEDSKSLAEPGADESAAPSSESGDDAGGEAGAPAASGD